MNPLSLNILCDFIVAMAAQLELNAAHRRTLGPDDLFKLEEIGDIAVAPDGQVVAFVRRRPRLSARTFQQPFLLKNDRADIWLVSLSGGVPTNLTDGELDGSGYWMPTWSPDGMRLAMLSTKGGDNVRLWVWEKATGHLMQLADRGIVPFQSYAWVDNRRLVALLLPKGEQPMHMSIERRAATVAMREWPRTWAGHDTTASILDSGVSVDLTRRPKSEIVLIDVQSGTVRPFSMAPQLQELKVAPDRRHLAFLKEVSLLQPDPVELLQHNDLGMYGFHKHRFQIGIADADGRVVTAAHAAKYVIPNSFQWSPESRRFAFIGVSAAEENGHLCVFRGDVEGSINAIPLPAPDPRALVWVTGENLLILAERDAPTAGIAKKRRTDWWLVSPGSAPRNLTESLEVVPSELVPDPPGRTFIGLAQGELLRFESASGEWTNLTSHFSPKIGSIAWPTVAASSSHDAIQNTVVSHSIVVSTTQGMSTDFYRVNVASGVLTRLSRPSEFATLAAYLPESEIALFTANETDGTYLNTVHGDVVRQLVETNRFLRDVAHGDVKRLDYRSLDGDELTAWLIMPANYEAGMRCPLVTWVYAGGMAGDTPGLLTRVNTDSPLNLQLLAAHGYAVLIPSMPLPPQGSDASDPYMELTKGVLPAIDKAIELGIADPQRLGLMGHSFGGFGTYGLVTQSNRFKAAIALAGLSDFVSQYGTFDARFRFEPNPQEYLFFQSGFETGWGRMGQPPWKDVGRYVRNSPLFYADRVQTPLLIVQGDMDMVSITQGEEFFTALYRQGKRARFIRYWGEGHVFTAPANIRDLWNHIYGWLDEFLGPPSSNIATAARR